MMRLILKDSQTSCDVQIFIDLTKAVDVLGLLPDSEVQFYRLERCVSLNQGRVYCHWKTVSNYEVVSYCNSKYGTTDRYRTVCISMLSHLCLNSENLLLSKCYLLISFIVFVLQCVVL